MLGECRLKRLLGLTIRPRPAGWGSVRRFGGIRESLGIRALLEIVVLLVSGSWR